LKVRVASTRIKRNVNKVEQPEFEETRSRIF
jgi:hypothetical protein